MGAIRYPRNIEHGGRAVIYGRIRLIQDAIDVYGAVHGSGNIISRIEAETYVRGVGGCPGCRSDEIDYRCGRIVVLKDTVDIHRVQVGQAQYVRDGVRGTVQISPTAGVVIPELEPARVVSGEIAAEPQPYYGIYRYRACQRGDVHEFLGEGDLSSRKGCRVLGPIYGVRFVVRHAVVDGKVGVVLHVAQRIVENETGEVQYHRGAGVVQHQQVKAVVVETHALHGRPVGIVHPQTGAGAFVCDVIGKLVRAAALHIETRCVVSGQIVAVAA